MNLQQFKVWVLAPHIESTNENINYYYDFSQSIQEYTKVFAELNLVWQWYPVTLANFKEKISEAISQTKTIKMYSLFLNLCDGDEINGAPGISVIHFLLDCKVAFTGSDSFFYNITTSKALMKNAFDDAGISHAAWKVITQQDDLIEEKFNPILYPIILKPSISGGSMGVGIKNVVNNFRELKTQVQNMLKGYNGWDLQGDGIIAEQFISGREFTIMLVGDYDATILALQPVERVFHTSLKPQEQFLSFDRLWEIYEEETPMPNNENFYEYAPVEDQGLISRLQQLSIAAYKACKGTGYTRADIRMDITTNQLYVLEVNAQCGLSEDENYTSIGAILKASKVSFTGLIEKILENSLNKFSHT